MGSKEAVRIMMKILAIACPPADGKRQLSMSACV